MIFCAHGDHDVLPLVIKLVVAVLSACNQFRQWTMLEKNVCLLMFIYTSKPQGHFPREDLIFAFSHFFIPTTVRIFTQSKLYNDKEVYRDGISYFLFHKRCKKWFKLIHILLSSIEVS